MNSPWERPWARIWAFALLTWVAHFALAGRMGLVYDDWDFLAPTINESGMGALEVIWHYIRTMYFGRPLAYIVPLAGGWLIGATGSFVPAFAACWAMVTLNALLLARLVQGRMGARLATLAGVAFILSPVDLTRPYLIHGLSLQVALALGLGAMHLVASGRVRSGVTLGALTLFMYESVFFLIIAAPFFSTHPWGRARWKTLVAYLFVSVVICGAIRLLAGEQRIADISLLGVALLFRVGAGLFLGPLFSIGLAIAGPVRVALPAEYGSILVRETPVAYIILHAFLAMILVYGAWRLKLAARIRSLIVETSRTPGSLDDAREARLLVVGVVMLPFAYLVSFTHFPANASRGFNMAVHLAASVPIALMTAAIAALVADRMSALGRWRAWALPLVYAFGVLVTGVRTQQQFAGAWQFQRDMYSGVFSAVPDMDSTTRVLLEIRDRVDEPTWSEMPIADVHLGWMMMPPRGFDAPALLVRIGTRTVPTGQRWYQRLKPSWYRTRLTEYNGRYGWAEQRAAIRRSPTGALQWQPNLLEGRWESLDDKRIVHLIFDSSGMHRIDGPFTLGGFTLTTTPRRPVQAPHRFSKLGALVVRS